MPLADKFLFHRAAQNTEQIKLFLFREGEWTSLCLAFGFKGKYFSLANTVEGTDHVWPVRLYLLQMGVRKMSCSQGLSVQ